MAGMLRREGATPKKGKKSRGGHEDVDDSVSMMSEDEAQSVFSKEVASKNADGEEMTPEDRQDQLVEQLAEKRASTRQAALTRLVDQLQQTFNPDFVSDRLETLQLYLLNNIRKGDAAEVVLASRALTLVSLTLGAGSEELVQAATPTLRDYLRNNSKNSAGRASVAEALGFLHFIGSLNDADTLDAMTLLVEALKSPTPLAENIATACWEAWGLLASTLPTHKLSGHIIEEYLPTLIRFLDDESTDVKTAAGENIALLLEARQQIDAEKGEAEPSDAAEHKDASSAAAAASAVAAASSSVLPSIGTADEAGMLDVGSDSEVKPLKRNISKQASAVVATAPGSFDLNALIAKLSALATDGSRFRGKKERASQRKSFRDILRTVEDGDVPDEQLKIEKSRHSFTGWAHVKQLNAVRDVLGKGLNVHFGQNDTLRDIFDLYIEAGDGVDDPNRKAASRAQSKAKALENFHAREKQRKKKTAMTNPHAED